MSSRTSPLFALLLMAVVSPGGATSSDPAEWPEPQRWFVQDGPAWLLPSEERRGLADLDEAARQAAIDEFLARDPLPATPENELEEGIRRRAALVRNELATPHDDRARLLFLYGRPTARREIDCEETYRPLEVWSYGSGKGASRLLLYKPGPATGYRLWMPIEPKRVLYTPAMANWLLQWEGYGKGPSRRRFDRVLCPESKEIDEITGTKEISTEFSTELFDRLRKVLEPPGDLAEWAEKAAVTPLPPEPEALPLEDLELFFPALDNQRMEVRLQATVPPSVELGIHEEKETREVRIAAEGVIEENGELFDTFRMLFVVPPPEGRPLAIQVKRLLRPGRTFVIRLRIRDEVGESEAYVVRGFRVPNEAIPIEEPPVPDDVVVALGEELAERPVGGKDSLLLVPPPTDVVFGLWSVETIVTGDRIAEVVFLVDGEVQMRRAARPFVADLRLPVPPQELWVRAEGYDEAGQLVAADEVVLNQPQGQLAVRILEPASGERVEGPFVARAEVVVPEGQQIERVEFSIGDTVVTTRDKPPWEASLEAGSGDDLAFLTVVAVLDDGSRAEDLRFLNAPDLEQVEVQLVELYTTVTDHSGRLVPGLEVEDFDVYEDGRPQEITKFQLVEDLPLTLGFAIDTSGSMAASLGEAQKAATGFLERIMTPRDGAFAVGFTDKPVLVMPKTDDVRALEIAFGELKADGWTAVHDSILFSLYYFRGVKGRRALILLTDGEDTASAASYRETLEYARRSGVAIYTIGLNTPFLDFKSRRKLEQFAKETGGRHFVIDKAEDLDTVYQEIEAELRSQYLIAYASDRPGGDEFRQVEVEPRRRGLEARTIQGYYP